MKPSWLNTIFSNFRIGKYYAPFILILIVAYLFKKGQRKFRNCNSNQIHLEEDTIQPQANRLFLNNLDFNPDVYTTAMYLGFVITIFAMVISSNYFNLLNQTVISSFIPPLMINFFLPLYMYVTNSSLRTFVCEDVFPFLNNLC